MADGRSLLCSQYFCSILASYLLLSLSIYNRSLSNEVDTSPKWFLVGGKFKTQSYVQKLLYFDFVVQEIFQSKD